MTQKQFNIAKEVEQISAIQRLGILLGEAKKKEQIILLYKLRNFYVEMYYEKKIRMLKQIRSFDKVEERDPVFQDLDPLDQL
jgi:hypothetical protein